MHAPTIDSTYENSAQPARRFSTADFYLTNPALPILRSVFFYCVALDLPGLRPLRRLHPHRQSLTPDLCPPRSGLAIAS